LWIKENAKEDALTKGYTVVDLATVMITHLSEVIRRYSHELLGRQEVQQLLDTLKETHPKVVEELIPNLMPLGGVVKVLQNLLKEQVPIRDLLAILETLADWASLTKELGIANQGFRYPDRKSAAISGSNHYQTTPFASRRLTCGYLKSSS
jgi:flagellar biosynthesis protein FlhA